MTTESLVLTEFPARHPTTGEPIEHVAQLTLNRPSQLNALSHELVMGLINRLLELDADDACRCIVIRGAGERAFAAGADIREMAAQTSVTLTLNDSFARWELIRRVRTPIVAAVRGFALGGGCELAMACDMIVAGDDAKFGQPEIKLGIIPGAGGTQRLTRAVGKARAMELILTGRTIDAHEADRIGLVSTVVAADSTFAAALDLAARIAAQPPLALMAAADAIDRADELALSAGLEFERRSFFLLFATDDQKEGMAAFLEKRPAAWKGR